LAAESAKSHEMPR